MLKYILVLAFTFQAVVARTPVRQCAGNLPLPNAVFFESRTNPCLAEPCLLSRASGRGITYVDFTPRTTANSIMPRVRAIVFGGIIWDQELPAEIVNNPCSILTQGSCPLPANVQASYRLELPVDPSTPLIPTDTEVTLFDHNNNVIFCYRLDTQLVA